MSLAEGVQGRVTYKPYATGAISSNSQPVSTVDPGNTGGQVLRRTSVSLNLNNDTYQSTEINLDRQITDFRHGVKRVAGSISGELSCGTYFEFMEAACRGTRVAAVSLSEVGLTSAAFVAATNTVTFGGGDPVALGLQVGMVVRFGNLAVTANNSTNFIITGFGGTSNRDVTIFPAPVDAAADTSFTVQSFGKSVSVPSINHVSRKFAIEAYHSDIDVYRLYTECRVGGINLALPATGMATIEIPVMGRNMETGTAAGAPFFTNPTAPTTTGIEAAVNGLLRVGGQNLGVVTGVNMTFNLNPTGDPVVGQNYVPEVFLGRANVSGQMTAMLEDLTLVNYFVNETEVEVLLYLLSGSGPTADALTIYLPRVKFGGGSIGMEGEGAQIVTMPFQALRNQVAALGKPATTIQFSDTAAT